jgi:uncharacterized protein
MAQGIVKHITYFIIGACIIITRLLLVIPRGTCRFYPSCSDYANDAIFMLPPHIALIKIIYRLFRCHPFSKGGYDPVIQIDDERNV